MVKMMRPICAHCSREVPIGNYSAATYDLARHRIRADLQRFRQEHELDG